MLAKGAPGGYSVCWVYYIVRGSAVTAGKEKNNVRIDLLSWIHCVSTVADNDSNLVKTILVVHQGLLLLTRSNFDPNMDK